MNPKKHTHSIVLLSGGLDSSTVLAIAQSESDQVTALSFDYGQRHDIELEASRRIATRMGVTRRVVTIDLAQFGGSALTDKRIDVPKSGSISSSIPVTYVPARNTIFLSYGLALAEVLGAGAIYIGVNALDYSGYPDCRPEYIARFQAMADVATKATISGTSIKIETPLIDMSKAQIITRGVELGVDYSLTISCYDPDREGQACGACDSCTLRAQGFRDAGVKDPTQYVSSVMIGR